MRVTIFTGSRLGPRQHAEAAAAFARRLAASGIGVVFGGGRVGLMGVVADAALAAGGEVIGVIPQHLVDREVAHIGLTRLEVVTDMHERKARMAELGDAFVALPGAAGTLEELFEVWTWGQLGLHEKPSALLDVGGFYRPLIEQLGVMAEQGYLEQAQLDALGVVADADEFLRFVGGYRHPPRKQLLMDELTSVAWLCVRDGRVLAVRSHGRDRFYLPGGKVEPGETHEQALTREVLEEIGVALTDVRPAFTVHAPAHGQPDGTSVTMHCFHAVAVGDPAPAGEIAELTWLAPDDRDLAAPAVQLALARIATAGR
jgi:uncharacterized protein (TIGR00730 family)